MHPLQPESLLQSATTGLTQEVWHLFWPVLQVLPLKGRMYKATKCKILRHLILTDRFGCRFSSLLTWNQLPCKCFEWLKKGKSKFRKDHLVSFDLIEWHATWQYECEVTIISIKTYVFNLTMHCYSTGRTQFIWMASAIWPILPVVLFNKYKHIISQPVVLFIHKTKSRHVGQISRQEIVMKVLLQQQYQGLKTNLLSKQSFSSYPWNIN